MATPCLSSIWRNYADAAADTVYNMLEDSQGSKFNEAGVHLRTAAGIFERLHKVLYKVMTVIIIMISMLRTVQSQPLVSYAAESMVAIMGYLREQFSAAAAVVHRGRFVWAACSLLFTAA